VGGEKEEKEEEEEDEEDEEEERGIFVSPGLLRKRVLLFFAVKDPTANATDAPEP
jgi:hypothetical protein